MNVPDTRVDLAPRSRFTGSGRGLMVAVLALVAALVIARVVTAWWLIEDGYAWWSGPQPTTLPRDLPAVDSAPVALTPPSTWFAAEDYPADALATGREGRVRVAVLVGADGRASACEVTQSSGAASLDVATCRVALRRSAFLPARRAGGDAVRARFDLPALRWALPRDGGAPSPPRAVPPRAASGGAVGVRGNPASFFGPESYPAEAMRAGAQGRTVAALSVNDTGTPIHCAVRVSSGNAALDARTCAIALGRVRFEPARDRQGDPIPSRYTLPVRWVLPPS